MRQYIPMESLFYGMYGIPSPWYGPIRALTAILELNEYVELLNFLAGKELTQHC